MTPNQLRELADALEPMAAAPRFDDLPVVEFCAWVRQCAEQRPAAWRVECRWVDRSKGGGWRKYADYGTEQAATSSQQVFANPGDIESRVVPLYAAPAAPQAEPKREPWSGYEAGHRAGYALALTERDPLRDALKTVIYELAALIPHPDKTLVDDWPCENAADRQCLQIAYTTAREALHGIGGSDAK